VKSHSEDSALYPSPSFVSTANGELHTLPVKHAGDSTVVAAAARRFAGRLGFSAVDAARFATAAAELASNVVRHGGGGSVVLCAAKGRLEVSAEDRGPGSAEKLGRLRHTPKPGGLGEGLNAVRRLMEGLAVQDREGGGVRVTAWIGGPPA